MRCRERRPRRSVDILELAVPKYCKYCTKDVEINIFCCGALRAALPTRLSICFHGTNRQAEIYII